MYKRINACVLLAFFALLCERTLTTAPSVDEIGHLPSGISHWKFERFDMYRVNPPLVRLVACFPSWLTDAEYGWSRYTDLPGRRPEFSIGLDWLRQRKLAFCRDFYVPRIVCLIFPIAGAFAFLLWLSRFGNLLGATACACWCIAPEILAHGPTIVPDVGSTAIGLIACYGCWNYCHYPSRSTALVVGGLMGLAMLTKLTWLTGLFVFPLTVFACRHFWRRHLPQRSIHASLSDFVTFSAIAMIVLNAGYLFEGTGTRLGHFQFCSEALGGPECNASRLGNRFADMWIAQVPVPFPKNYVLGIDYLKYEVEEKKWSFLLGEWRFGSWWYYYIVTTLVKTPLATLMGAALGLIYVIHRWRKGTLPLEVKTMLICIGVPAIVCFVSVSYQGGFNHHHRYVMMINPLMFVLVAALALPDNGRISKLRIGLVSSLTVGMLCATFSVAPHYLSFFNSLAGGPSNGWKVLGFSNIDWGQDLLFVDKWIKEHPECRPLAFELDYFGMNGELFEMEKRSPVKLKAKTLTKETLAAITTPKPDATNAEDTSLVEGGERAKPADNGPVYYLISVKHLYNLPDHSGLQYLQQLTPVDRIAYSFHIYKIEDEAALKRVASSE